MLQGGTPYQDTPTQVPGSHRHSALAICDDHEDHVTLESGPRLCAPYSQRKTVKVNALHHEAVKKLGRGLKVEARSTGDGLIEAARI
jgi:putative glutamine amidotransferase